MNTSRLALCLACVGLLPVPLRAAPDSATSPNNADDYINLLKLDLRATKAQVVVDTLELSSAEAEIFWPIYQEYDLELNALNRDRIAVLRDFAANYGSIDDTKARELSRKTFEFMKRRLSLLERYANRVDKALSPATAARFAQIENQMLMLIDVQIASDLPLIPRSVILDQMAPAK